MYKMKTGCIGKSTLYQGIAMSIFFGVVCLFVHTHETAFDWYWPFVGGFLAPFVVDAIRPVYYRD